MTSVDIASTDYRDAFFRAYVKCALWSSVDTSDEPMDARFSPDDVAFGSMANMREECDTFITANGETLAAYRDTCPDPEQAGHDFWLTRNGHGTGFWDRGAGEAGDRLATTARAYGEAYLWDGEDGRVYFSY